MSEDVPSGQILAQNNHGIMYIATILLDKDGVTCHLENGVDFTDYTLPHETSSSIKNKYPGGKQDGFIQELSVVRLLLYFLNHKGLVVDPIQLPPRNFKSPP
ncbi:MAG: hypothetical protein NTZ74_04540 [Chloroflexi bacterium]|nr:hypothetical protein [Chloroflexota bacterium]